MYRHQPTHPTMRYPLAPSPPASVVVACEAGPTAASARPRAAGIGNNSRSVVSGDSRRAARAPVPNMVDAPPPPPRTPPPAAPVVRPPAGAPEPPELPAADAPSPPDPPPNQQIASMLPIRPATALPCGGPRRQAVRRRHLSRQPIPPSSAARNVDGTERCIAARLPRLVGNLTRSAPAPFVPPLPSPCRRT